MGTLLSEHTIRTWVEDAWNQGKVDAHDDLYATSYNPAFLPEPFPRNLAGLKAFIRHMRAGMPDLRMAIEEMVAEGDKVAWRFTATGTQTGSLLGFPPLGRERMSAGSCSLASPAASGPRIMPTGTCWACCSSLACCPNPQA